MLSTPKLLLFGIAVIVIGVVIGWWTVVRAQQESLPPDAMPLPPQLAEHVKKWQQPPEEQPLTGEDKKLPGVSVDGRLYFNQLPMKTECDSYMKRRFSTLGLLECVVAGAFKVEKNEALKANPDVMEVPFGVSIFFHVEYEMRFDKNLVSKAAAFGKSEMEYLRKQYEEYGAEEELPEVSYVVFQRIAVDLNKKNDAAGDTFLLNVGDGQVVAQTTGQVVEGLVYDGVMEGNWPLKIIGKNRFCVYLDARAEVAYLGVPDKEMRKLFRRVGKTGTAVTVDLDKSYMQLIRGGFRPGEGAKPPKFEHVL